MKFELNRLQNYSDDAVIEEIHRVANIVDEERLSISSFNKHSKVHSSTIVNKFGSWIKGLEAAGLHDKIDGRIQKISKMSDEENSWIDAWCC